jgi:Transposase, Mutator family
MSGSRTETATGRGPGRPVPARSSLPFRRSGVARTSRASSSRVAESSRRSSQSCRRLTWRVSTRKVDQVVESQELEERGLPHLPGLGRAGRRLPQPATRGPLPYLWLDAKVEKVRDSGRVVRKCLVLAYAVHESGYREVIGLDVGECETGLRPSNSATRSVANADMRRVPVYSGRQLRRRVRSET